MVDWRDSKISIRRQCELLGLNRSSWYYQPKGQSELEILLMNLLNNPVMFMARINHPGTVLFILTRKREPLELKLIDFWLT